MRTKPRLPQTNIVEAYLTAHVAGPIDIVRATGLTTRQVRTAIATLRVVASPCIANLVSLRHLPQVPKEEPAAPIVPAALASRLPLELAWAGVL